MSYGCPSNVVCIISVSKKNIMEINIDKATCIWHAIVETNTSVLSNGIINKSTVKIHVISTTFVGMSEVIQSSCATILADSTSSYMKMTSSCCNMSAIVSKNRFIFHVGDNG